MTELDFSMIMSAVVFGSSVIAIVAVITALYLKATEPELEKYVPPQEPVNGGSHFHIVNVKELPGMNRVERRAYARRRQGR